MAGYANRPVVHLTTLALLVMTGPVMAIPLYSLTNLGGMGGNYAVARAINDPGEIVGGARDASGTFHAVLFDPTGGGANQSLGALGTGTGASARDINNLGQIVGRATNSNGDGRATLFDRNNAANNLDLGDLGGPESSANAISDSGEIIVGEADTPDVGNTGNPIPKAARFAINGAGAIDLTPVTVDPVSSVAFDVNDSDVAVGDRPVNGRAVSFSTSLPINVTEFGGIGNTFGQAFATNAAGDVVGETFPGGVIRATLFDKTGGGANVDLGTVPGQFGSLHSRAFAINDSGAIVGHAAIVPNPGFSGLRAAFFDSATGEVFDLNDFVDPTDPDFGTLSLHTARAINASGQIVGLAEVVGQNSVQVAFLLTPIDPNDVQPVPEPSTIGLLMAALSVMAMGIRVRGRSRSDQPNPR